MCDSFKISYCKKERDSTETLNMILDELEAPLSPLKQLSLIAMVKDMVEDGGQFKISTHSPILMAIPDADIYVIEDEQMKQTEYKALEQVTLTRDFLNNVERFLRHL